MRKVLLIVVSVSFFSCGGRYDPLPQIDDDIWIPVSNDEQIGTAIGEKNNHDSFNGLLPYEENQEKEMVQGTSESFNELLRVTPIFPQGTELQRCVGSTLLIFRNEQPTRNLNYLPLAICFGNAISTNIDNQMANELLVFNRILDRDTDNRVLLFVPERIANRRLARRRIEIVRNFLIREGANPEKVIEVEDFPPE